MSRVNELLELYKDNGWNEFIFTSRGIPIPFNDKWKKIGFNISGGADSAILFYNVAKHIEEKKLDIELHTVSHIRCWKTRPWQKHIRLEVIRKLKEKFPGLKVIEHENYIAPEIEMGAVGSIIPHNGKMKSGDQLSNSSYSEYIAFNNNFDAFYCGTTSNPVHLYDKKFGGAENRNVADAAIIYSNMINGGIIHIRPFLYLTKDLIIGDYFNYGLTDLLNTTRSCEQDDPNILAELSRSQGIVNSLVKNNFKDAWRHYKSGDIVPICMDHCFWCVEREWAIKECLQ